MPHPIPARAVLDAISQARSDPQPLLDHRQQQYPSVDVICRRRSSSAPACPRPVANGQNPRTFVARTPCLRLIGFSNNHTRIQRLMSLPQPSYTARRILGLEVARWRCRVSPCGLCEVVGRPRRIATTPGSIVADIDPDAAFLDAADHRIRSPARRVDRTLIGVSSTCSRSARMTSS